MLIRACEELMSYLRLSGERIGGLSYGTERICIRGDTKQELHRLVSIRFTRLAGKPNPFSLDDVSEVWTNTRKGNYKALRDAKPITNDRHALPLFEIEEETPCAILYAYWGRNQNLDRHLVKVGYTTQELTAYLRSLSRMYDPQLMASCPGDYSEEKAFHSDWRRFLAEGREWYWATEAMFGVFRREWNTTAQFEALIKEALKTSPYHV